LKIAELRKNLIAKTQIQTHLLKIANLKNLNAQKKIRF